MSFQVWPLLKIIPKGEGQRSYCQRPDRTPGGSRSRARPADPPMEPRSRGATRRGLGAQLVGPCLSARAARPGLALLSRVSSVHTRSSLSFLSPGAMKPRLPPLSCLVREFLHSRVFILTHRNLVPLLREGRGLPSAQTRGLGTTCSAAPSAWALVWGGGAQGGGAQG